MVDKIQEGLEQVPRDISACSTSHICPVQSLYMSLVCPGRLHTVCPVLVRSIRINYSPRLLFVYSVSSGNTLIAMADSFKVMERQKWRRVFQSRG